MPEAEVTCWYCPDCGHIQMWAPRRNALGNTPDHLWRGVDPHDEEDCQGTLIEGVVRPRGEATDA